MQCFLLTTNYAALNFISYGFTPSLPSSTISHDYIFLMKKSKNFEDSLENNFPDTNKKNNNNFLIRKHGNEQARNER